MADSSLRGIMRDKRFQLAAAGVGGVGLVALLMRRGGGAPAAGQTVIQPAAGLDSSASDLYNALQSLGQGWQNDLRGFTDQLSNVNDKLDKLPNGGTGNPPVTTAPAPAPTPPAPKTTNVLQGWHVDQYLKDAGFSWNQLATANPNLAQITTYANRNGYWDLLSPAQRQSGGAPFLVFGANRTLIVPS